MSEQLEPIIFDDVVWGKAYYEMHEVDAIITQKNKQIAELKAMPHTDNSDVIEKMATEIAKLKKEIESMKVKFREFNDNVCKKIVDASRTMSTISQDAQMDFYEEFINEAK